MIPVTLCCALCVTIVSSTAALLYMAYGHDEDLGSWGYCEHARGQEPWVFQPVNTSSNIAFVVVGLVMAASCDYHLPKRYWRAPTNQNLLTQTRAYGALWSSLMCLLGAASAVFHSSFTTFGMDLDQSMILLNTAFMAVYSALRKRPNLRFATFLMVYITLAIALLVLTFAPTKGDVEGAAFLLLVVIATGLEVRYKISSKRQSGSSSTSNNSNLSCGSGVTEDNADIRFVWAALACLAFGITILYLSDTQGKPLCFPDSAFQGHGLWHVVCAVGVGFVFLYHLSVNEETWRIASDDDEFINRDENAEEVIAIEVESKL